MFQTRLNAVIYRCWMGLGFDGGKQAVVEMVLHALKVSIYLEWVFNTN